MNELELKGCEEKYVTTKELAEVLGVDVRTVQRAANEHLDPTTVQTRVINGGQSNATPAGEIKISLKTLVLQKGVAYINKILGEEA